MATRLTKAVIRETDKAIQGRNIMVTIAPAGGSQTEVLIGLRLKGRRGQYVATLSDIYRRAALDYGLKEKRAKAEARKMQIPWKRAKKEFVKQNSI